MCNRPAPLVLCVAAPYPPSRVQVAALGVDAMSARMALEQVGWTGVEEAVNRLFG
jgi:hypothetical protein